MYSIDRIRITKPNMKKAGSNKWDPNWLGYMNIEGKYTSGSKIIPIMGIQFSLMNTSGKVSIKRCKSSQWNNTNHPLYYHNDLLKAVQDIVNGMDIVKVLEDQPSLIATYRIGGGQI